MKHELERHIEARCMRWLSATLPMSKQRKMNGLGHAAWPDRLIVLPHGVTIWIEFKRPGAPLTKLQRDLHKHLARLGQTVYTTDNDEDFQRIIQHHAPGCAVDPARVSKGGNALPRRAGVRRPTARSRPR